MVLDVKPWDDETDMKEMEKLVRMINCDGLVWGQASKLVPLAYGIHKLQLMCVVEDEKVDSVFSLRRPYDLVALMQQEQRAVLVEELKQKLMMQKEEIDLHEDKETNLEGKIYSMDEDCIAAGKPLTELDLYVSTIVPFDYKEVNGDDYLDTVETSHTFNKPNCPDVIDLDFSMHAFEHLMSQLMSLNPVRILKGDAEEEKAETARLSSFVGAIAIGELVKSTLGPKGMDKILLSEGPNEGKVKVTNDGATILRSVGVDNPAAKILVDISKVQDDEVGDGTTSVAVLASELLKEAEKLIAMKLHPQTVISGWRKASKKAQEALTNTAQDNSANPEKFKEDLMNIAGTTLGSKILSQHKDFFAKLSVDAVLRLKGSGNLQAIQIIKKLGESLTDSFLDEGFLLDKKVGVNQPKRIENARILIANTPMDTDKIKIFGSRVRVDSVAKVAEMEVAEKEKMKDKVDMILKHNINVFINRQLIYNYPEQLFSDAGIMAIEHADFDGIERLALVTGGEIVSTFSNPDKVKLGHCKLIEEVMIGEDKLLKFSGVPLGEACTIVLRGATQQILDEAERSLHDALCVLSQTVKETRIVYGGGSAEMLMANAVVHLAEETAGKEALAMESFARALHQLPTTIADNAGYDSAELISELRAAHVQGKHTYGLNMQKGCIDDMQKLGVTESFIVKRQVLISAAEAAEMILRVDDIIKAAPCQRAPDYGH